jgi:prepilin-type N-terminal cleavage/methylation domain-containing protein
MLRAECSIKLRVVLLAALLLVPCVGTNAAEKDSNAAEISPQEKLKLLEKNRAEKIAAEKVAEELAAEAAAQRAAEAAKAQEAAFMDMRDTLALTALERDALQADNRTMRSQLWFAAICALLSAIAAGWLGFRFLKQQNPRELEREPGKAQKDSENPIPAAKQTAVVRKATITIRNSETQREEVSEKIETRRIVQKTAQQTASEAHRQSAKVTRNNTHKDDSSALTALQPKKTTPDTAIQRRSTAVAPGTSVFRTPAPEANELPSDAQRTETALATARVQNPKTVRVEQTSDRLKTVEVAVKPGTRTITRDGFSLLEVMISVAVLATVLASVIGGVYSINLSRELDKEQAYVEEISRSVIERIMSERFRKLKQRSGQDVLVSRFSYDIPGGRRKDNGVTMDRLKNDDFITAPIGLNNFNLYVEHYDHKILRDLGKLHNLDGLNLFDESIRESSGNTVIQRIVITWRSRDGGQRSHIRWVARRE